MMKLTTYDKYKDSGIEWLGEVPKDWEVKRIKDFVGAIIDTEHKTVPFREDGKYLVLRTSNIRDARITLKNAKFTDKAGFTEWTKRGKPTENDVIITREAPAGEAVVVPKKPILCLGQRTVLLKPLHDIINSSIIVYNFYGEAIKKFIKTHSNGSTVSHLNMREIPYISISFPKSNKEQALIADYLDQVTTKIDKKIDLLTQKIKHYQYLKTALINRAVIKGLDGSVEIKDSGVEWIGEIPKHWEVKRIKELFKEINYRSSTGSEDLLSVSEYYGVALRATKVNEGDFITNANTLEGYKKCNIDDIVMNIMLAWKKSLGVSEFNGIVSPAYAVFRPLKDTFSKYYHYLFRTDLYAAEFKKYSRGIMDSRLRLYPDKFFAIHSVVPPETEQQQIVEYLNQKTSTIDKIIATIITQIECQKELRKTLINDVVTGKIKVENN